MTLVQCPMIDLNVIEVGELFTQFYKVGFLIWET